MANWPTPANDTGIGVHSDPNAYFKPADPYGYADDLWNHGVRWYLAWLFDENNADYIKIMRQRGIEVIMRLGPAYMPHPNISMGVVDAYVAAGVRWAIIGNEWNLHEEWTRENNWQGLEKPIRMCADQFVKYVDVMRPKGLWCLTPPPSLGGHWLHRDWFNRFCTALSEIARERGQTFEQLLTHCGIGIHCRSVGNPLDKGPENYDCSAREWERFRDTVKSFQTDKGVVIPMANTEAFDEPQWLPKVGSDYDWNLWQNRNLEQMRWFNPTNPGYKYPLQIMCNCHWVVHADRFSPWPQCGLFSNYIHYIQRGDYTTDLWRAMPGTITWQRGEPQPQPPTPPEPEPEPMPSEIEYVGLSQEMKAALTLTVADKSKPYWKVWKVEIQPATDNMSAWCIAPDGHIPVFFWAGGETEMPWKGPDIYSPPGAREGAYSQPMHHPWSSYGMRMDGNSEALFGFGLYGDALQLTHTAHHPVLVYFRLVSGTSPEPPQPPPEPPEPPTVPDIPYELVAALNARLVAAGLANVVDMRKQIEDAYVDVALMESQYKRSLGPDGLQSITLHHTGSTAPLNVLGIAKYHTDPKPAGCDWPNIAPHWVIDRVGTCWFTKRLKYWTPQAGNAQANKYGISIEVHGRFDINPATSTPYETVTDSQLRALRILIEEHERFVGGGWGQCHPLPLVPHNCLVATKCPGNLYEKYWESLDQ